VLQVQAGAKGAGDKETDAVGAKVLRVHRVLRVHPVLRVHQVLRRSISAPWHHEHLQHL